MTVAIYPGTFDPVTNGHLDIIRRSAKLFEQVIIAVAKESYKDPLFTLEERYRFLQEVTEPVPNVKVEIFSGLLIDFVRAQNANIVIRGLRAVSDFEYEFQMALMNKKLNDQIETIFLMTDSEYSFISSSIIKQVASLGGCVHNLVPLNVEQALREKFFTRE